MSAHKAMTSNESTTQPRWICFFGVWADFPCVLYPIIFVRTRSRSHSGDRIHVCIANFKHAGLKSGFQWHNSSKSSIIVGPLASSHVLQLPNIPLFVGINVVQLRYLIERLPTAINYLVVRNVSPIVVIATLLSESMLISIPEIF